VNLSSLATPRNLAVSGVLAAVIFAVVQTMELVGRMAQANADLTAALAQANAAVAAAESARKAAIEGAQITAAANVEGAKIAGAANVEGNIQANIAEHQAVAVQRSLLSGPITDPKQRELYERLGQLKYALANGKDITGRRALTSDELASLRDQVAQAQYQIGSIEAGEQQKREGAFRTGAETYSLAKDFVVNEMAKSMMPGPKEYREPEPVSVVPRSPPPTQWGSWAGTLAGDNGTMEAKLLTTMKSLNASGGAYVFTAHDISCRGELVLRIRSDATTWYWATKPDPASLPECQTATRAFFLEATHRSNTDPIRLFVDGDRLNNGSTGVRLPVATLTPVAVRVP
jgi:hypothetical protein